MTSMSTADQTVDIISTATRYLRLVAYTRHDEQHNPRSWSGGSRSWSRSG